MSGVPGRENAHKAKSKPRHKPGHNPRHKPTGGTTPAPQEYDLHGLWAWPQLRGLDDKAAIAAGHVQGDGKTPALHGTYNRLRYLLVRMDGSATDPAAAIVVFDDEGRASQFTRSAPDQLTWTQQKTAVHYTYPGGTPRPQQTLPALKLEIPATLVLKAYTDADAPPGKQAGDLYVGSDDATATNPLFPATLIYSPSEVSNNDSLTWLAADGKTSLSLARALPQSGPPDHSQGPFANVFGKSPFSQISLPFSGFDPRHMGVATAAGTYETTGTDVTGTSYPDSNPGQSFDARLVFNFPRADSYGYTTDSTFSGQPNLPIGRRYISIDASGKDEHGAMISSVAERVTSWTASMGLSGGMASMLVGKASATFGGKTEHQRTTESRYSITRSVELLCANTIDLPSLTLKDEFVDDVMQVACNVLLGLIKDPSATSSPTAPKSWDWLVARYGTHYLHAVTQGKLDFSETRFSLQSEVTLNEQSVKVKGFNPISAALDAVSNALVASGGKGDSIDSNEVAASWASKNGVTVNASDVVAFSVGKDQPLGLAILYDLRPLTELLGPALFGYNPALAPFGPLAPWVWTTVRQSFEAYLKSIGMDKPLDPSLADDLAPLVLTITFPNITVTEADHRWMSSSDDVLYLSGTISFAEADGDPSLGTPDPDRQLCLASTNYQPDRVKVSDGGAAPSGTQFECVLAMRRRQPPHLKLAYDLWVTNHNEQWTTKDNDAFAVWGHSPVIDQAIASKTTGTPLAAIKVGQTKGLDIDYTLSITVARTDLDLGGAADPGA